MNDSLQAKRDTRRRCAVWLMAVFAAAGTAAVQLVAIPALLPRMVESRVTPAFLETLQLRIWTGWFAALALAGFAAAMRLHPSGMSPRRLAALLVTAGIALRFATPDMAFNSIVRPDGVHFSVVAQQLVSGHGLFVPTGNALLPARTLPGESLVQAATQWLDRDHPGAGAHAVWACAIAVILAAGALGRRAGGAISGWVAMLLLALSPLHGWYSRQLMSEVPWGGLVLASAGLLAFGKGRAGPLCLAGVLGGLGLLFKSSHLLVMLGLLAGWLLSARRAGLPALRGLAPLAFGLAIGSAPAFAYNQAVLGGWLRTAYHVYWPGWATASEALGIEYLWSAPLIKGEIGNLPYYAIALLGFDPRPERMILLPGAAIVLAILILRGRRGSPPPRDGGAVMFRTTAVCVGLLYGGACLVYSFQDPRFLLPILPLSLTALAPAIARGLPEGLAARSAASWLGGGLLALTLALGAAIVATETLSRRVPEKQLLAQLAREAAPYDVLVSDEDPVLLTCFGVWTDATRLLPLLLPGELWFPQDPATLYREQGVAVAPFEGTVPLVADALRAGRRVAVYVRRPHDRPEAWREFREHFDLMAVPGSQLPWFRAVRLAPSPEGAGSAPHPSADSPPREDPNTAQAGATAPPTNSVFMMGEIAPAAYIANERSLPVHPVQVRPFWLAPTETDQESFAAFLNDMFPRGNLRATSNDSAVAIERMGTNGVPVTLCVLADQEANLGLRFDAAQNPPFRIAPVAAGALPMVLVTWHGAAAYCNWRSRREGFAPAYDDETFARTEGNGYRLPTEAEWEFAATWNGVRKRRFAWGAEWRPDLGNVADSPRDARAAGDPFTVPVDRRAPWTPIAEGKPAYYHLTGNVWEWCDDWYADYPLPADQPAGPPTGTVRVVRGGSYRSYEDSAWAAFRGIATPETATPDIGFRIARPRD